MNFYNGLLREIFFSPRGTWMCKIRKKKNKMLHVGTQWFKGFIRSCNNSLASVASMTSSRNIKPILRAGLISLKQNLYSSILLPNDCTCFNIFQNFALVNKYFNRHCETIAD